MKKNKTIAYALAATLLVGGTFAGTKAWFTASGEVDSGLVVTTGSMGLEVNSEKNWTVIEEDGYETEITNKTNGNDFKNAKPGDAFEKIVTIKNTGSLDQVLEVNGGSIDNTKNKNFTVTLEGLDKIQGVLSAGSNNTKQFKIKVATNVDNMKSNDPDITNDGENGVDDEAREFKLLESMEKITINARQTNAQ